MAHFEALRGKRAGYAMLGGFSARTPLDGAAPSAGNGATSGSTSAAPASSISLYLGVGVGVGCFLLVAIVAVVVSIVRKRSQNRRAITELEDAHHISQAVRRPELAQVPRPSSMARCGALSPLRAQGGWDALGSTETVHEPELVARPDERKRSSLVSSKRFKYRGIPLKRFKHLSAFMESPKSGRGKSPSPAIGEDGAARATPKSRSLIIGHPQTIHEDAGQARQDALPRPESPKPEVLPSFAIKSPGRYGAAIANPENPRAIRSVSTSAIRASDLDGAVFPHSFRLERPSMHARSLSLGAPLTRPPSGPVPPLPVIPPQLGSNDKSARYGVCISRMSSSSQESAGSSVLVTSPMIRRNDGQHEPGSPTIEDVVADDDRASLKAGVNRQWQDPRVTGPRPNANNTTMSFERSRSSIRANIIRYSNENALSRRMSSSSTASDGSAHDRLSIPQIGTAGRMSIKRVSSSTSLNTDVKTITTPTRDPKRPSTVLANGSPAERKKTSVLRDISGNANGGKRPSAVSRQASASTLDSTRSSNGNPFQWDSSTQSLRKPSALKGSPNARKGHRRQNCVRISTLTPRVLGPPPSRSTSPSIMYGISEEEDGDGKPNNPGLGFVTHEKRLSRPLSTSSKQNLRMQTLRASLTPSSPTLSAWNAYHEHHPQQEEHSLPSLPSDRSLLSPPGGGYSTLSRRTSRSSGNFSLPVFPSPGRATVAPVQQAQPIPEFCFSRPSTDAAETERSSSPFALYMSSDEAPVVVDLPSSPPLVRGEAYDPAWPMVEILAPRERREYDPTSPPLPEGEDASSPLSFPFASREARTSPRSRPASFPRAGEDDDSPPCSPRSTPADLGLTFTKRAPPFRAGAAAAAETLTSANASAVMARMVSTSHHPIVSPAAPTSYPTLTNIPTLLPPSNKSRTTTALFASPTAVSAGAAPPPSPPPKSSKRPRAPSYAARAPFLPTIPQSSDDVAPPSKPSDGPPPVATTKPHGPRTAPSPSVLHHALALRRMNSEINCLPTSDRNSRRYVRLGREASPLLPWIGTPGNEDGEGGVFDFDFDAQTHPGAAGDGGIGRTWPAQGSDEVGFGGAGGGSVMDEIDLGEVERMLPGALAGFEASSSNLPTPKAQAQAEKSGWADDGERCWSRPSPLPKAKQEGEAGRTDWNPWFSCVASSAAGVGAEQEDKTPTQRLAERLDPRWAALAALAAQQRGAGVPAVGTPGSLYDADGFLR